MRLLLFTGVLVLALVPHSEGKQDFKKFFDAIHEKLLHNNFMGKTAVTIEKTAESKNLTYVLREYHSLVSGVHSIRSEHSQASRYLFDSNNIFVSIKDDKCNTTKADVASKDEENYLYMQTTTSGVHFQLGATSILEQLDEQKLAIKDTEETPLIRGVRCYHGEADIIPIDGEQIVISVYFPIDIDKNNVDQLNVSMPLRVVKLVTFRDGHTSKTTLDFFDFESIVQSNEAELYENLLMEMTTEGCTGLSESNEFPSIGEMLTFDTEVHEADNTVTQTTEFFDSQDMISRCDKAGSDGRALKEIIDTKHGIRYDIEDQCKASANLNGEEIIGDGSKCSGALVMQAILRNEKKFFIGQSEERGIPCNVYEVRYTKDDEFTVARFFISRPGVHISFGEKSEATKGVPVKVIVKKTVKGLSTETVIKIFNFMSFDEREDFLDNFDVTECVPGRTFGEFKLHNDLPFDSETFMAQLFPQLLRAVRESIEWRTGLSVLRLPYLEIVLNSEQDFLVTFSVLEPPAYLSSFSEDEKAYSHSKLKKDIVKDTEECAEKCIEDTETDCQAMLYCEDDKSCFKFASRNSSDWGLKTDGQVCHAFYKSKGIDFKHYVKTEEALATLSESISKGDVSFTLKKDLVFKAQDFRKYLTQFDEGSRGAPYNIEVKDKTIIATDTESFEAESSRYTAACYRKCLSNSEISCSTFSHCSDGSCILNSRIITGVKNADIMKNITTDRKGCTVYSMNFLDQFEKIEGKRRVSGSKNEIAATNAYDCAQNCRSNDIDGKECRGFDFCAEDNTCYFYDSHYGLDDGASGFDKSSRCDHYALHFSADYTPLGRNILEGVKETTVDSVSLDGCAKRCSENSNGKCNTFAFCEDNLDGSICHMYTQDLAKGTQKKSDKCTLFHETKQVDDIINPARQEDATKTDDVITGMSNGGFAGLLISMFIVGVILGIIGLVFYPRVKTMVGRGGDSSLAEGSSITYTNQRNDDA